MNIIDLLIFCATNTMTLLITSVGNLSSIITFPQFHLKEQVMVISLPEFNTRFFIFLQFLNKM